MLKEGTKVRVVQPVDLEPYTTLAEGERGEVVEVSDYGPGGPSVTVKLEREHKGLKQFSNTAYLVGPELSYIRRDAWTLPPCFRAYAVAFCTALVASSFAEVALAHSMSIPSTIETLLSCL